MDSSTMLFSIFYLIVFLLAIYLIVSMMVPKQVIVTREETIVSEPSWPWSITSYTWWPHWSGWWSGGKDGGYHRSEQKRSEGRHEGRPWGGAGRSAHGGRK